MSGMLRQPSDDHLSLWGAEALQFVVRHLLGELALRIFGHFTLLEVDGRLHHFALRLSPEILANPHRERTREQREETADENRGSLAFGDADPGDDAERRKNAVLHSEDDLANASAFFQRSPLLRVGNARSHLLPARDVDDDLLYGRGKIGMIVHRFVKKIGRRAARYPALPWEVERIECRR